MIIFNSIRCTRDFSGGILMKNKNKSQDNQNQLAIQAAELAIVGAAITTLGDAIATMSAVLALEAEKQEQNNQNYSSKNGNQDMQKQIDYLTSEIEKLKKQVNSPNSRRMK